ncbi:hypothetical protein [Streptomyces sp. TLI_171]|nr:hypothetical protein [Streptomyces sp. TLI_171]RKE05076.1 hypothetical protein BX266_7328 [Streptomyces sp. TLI_171]
MAVSQYLDEARGYTPIDIVLEPVTAVLVILVIRRLTARQDVALRVAARP